MKDVNLSKRMEAVVNMVSPQSFTIADVGCDHAYVSIALVKRGIADKMIAMDVRTGPLDIARRNVAEAGLSDRIDIRLGDGLEKLNKGEADTIIIAGMGGLLMKGILERGMDILNCEEKRPVLILQPQSDLKEVRMFLLANEYDIVCENMLVEDGKHYTIMRAEPMKECLVSQEASAGTGKKNATTASDGYTEVELVYGRYNLEHGNDVLYEYLLKEKEVFMQIETKVRESIARMEANGEEIPMSTKSRVDSVTYELDLNEKALQYYSGVKA